MVAAKREAGKARNSQGGLSRAACRVLDRLAEPEAVALPDPTRDVFLFVRGRSGGVSLGRGAFPEAVLRELLDRDLVRRDGQPGRALITETGQLFLKRLAAGGDAGERFAAQHRDLSRVPVNTGTGVEQLLVNARESPLAWLRRRRDNGGEPLIEAASFEAGERLRRDLTLAGLLPGVTARWDGAVGGGGVSLRDPAAATDATVAARQRVRQALAAVGPDFSDLLLDLCGFLKGLELIERERRWPPRSGKVVVRLALGQLARHYGLANEASGPASRGIRRWTTEAA